MDGREEGERGKVWMSKMGGKGREGKKCENCL